MADHTENNTIEALLPFYVNGTLTDDEKKLVEQEIKNTPALQEEVLFLQGLRQHVKQQDTGNSPGEFGLKRLQRTIEAESKTSYVASNSKWRIATIAACLMLVVQTVSHYETEDTFNAAGGHTTLAHQGQLVSVTFTPDVTELAIRQFLLETNARIISGPSALGIYQLSVPDTMTDVITVFTQRKDVIESIQKEQ